MRLAWGRSAALLIWAGLVTAGSLALVRLDIAQRRDAFQTDARIAHRLLSQRAAQHDAILATLVLLSPAIDKRDQPEQRLSAVQPQVKAVLRRDPGETWPDAAVQDAEGRSRAAQQAALAHGTAGDPQFTLVRAGTPSSFALVIDVQRMVPWDEWPIERDGPVAVVLAFEGNALVIQAGQTVAERPFGLTEGFVFNKRLATSSQPFDLQLRHATGPAQWPWRWLVAWAVLCAAAVAAFNAWQRAQRTRRRAEEWVRVGQVTRLNAMGEMAAGVAHELNQPLTAVMANTQAARRLLDDEPPQLEAARQAMTQATAQARRAADVVARLRRLVETPALTRPTQAVQLDALARQVLDLFEPQLQLLGAVALVQGPAVWVQADPVALEQIIHNLVSNALHALEAVAQGQRRLVLHVAAEQGQGPDQHPAQGILSVRDTGLGIPPEALSRLFEPFFTTRQGGTGVGTATAAGTGGGLGLGLSLCETLTSGMSGTLSARNLEPRGAEFRLALPLAGGAA